MLVWLKLSFIFIMLILISFVFMFNKYISILITGEFLLLYFFFCLSNLYLIFDIAWVIPFAFCVVLILSFELALSILLLIIGIKIFKKKHHTSNIFILFRIF